MSDDPSWDNVDLSDIVQQANDRDFPGHKMDDAYQAMPTGNPEEASKVLGLSKQLGMEPSEVAQDVPSAQILSNKPDAKTLNNIKKSYPATAALLSDPNNMALAHDDHENLTKHEGAVKAFSDAWQSARMGDDINALSKIQRSNGPSSLYEDRIKQMESEKAAIDQRLGNTGLAGDITSTFSSLGHFFYGGLKAGADSARDPVGSRHSITSGNPLFGAIGYVKDSAAEPMYRDLLARGVDPVKAGHVADVVGYANVALQTALAFGGGKVIGDLAIKPVTELAGKLATRAPVAAGLFKMIAGNPKAFAGLSWPRAIYQAAISDLESGGVIAGYGAAQAGINEAGRAYAEDNRFKLGPVAEGAVSGFGQGLVLGGAGFMAHIGNHFIDSRNIEMSRQAFLKFAALSEASKLKERMPDLHGDFTQVVHSGTAVETAYIDAHALGQAFEKRNLDPQQAMASIGLGDKYAAAIAAKDIGDQKVAIPMSKVIQHFGPDMAALSEDMTFDPNGPTLKQYKVEQERQLEIDTENTKKVLGDAEQTIASDPEAKKVYDQVVKEFSQTAILRKPEFSTDDKGLPIKTSDADWAKSVEAGAKAVAARALVEGPKQHVTPLEWWNVKKDHWFSTGDERDPQPGDFKSRPNEIPEAALRQPGDLLEKGALTVTGEAIPSKNVGNAVNYADPATQARFTDKTLDIVHDIGDALGFPVSISRGDGGYEGAIHPNIIAEIMPTGDAAVDAGRARSLARTIQLVTKQDAVPWFKADSAAGHNGVLFTFDDISPEREQTFFKHLQDAMGKQAGFTRLNSKEIAVIDYDGTDTNGVLNKLNALKEQHGKELGIEKAVRFGSNAEYGPVEDWSDSGASRSVSGDTSGTAGSSHLSAWVSTRSADFEKLLRDFTEYGDHAFSSDLDKEIWLKQNEGAVTGHGTPGPSVGTFFQPGPNALYKSSPGLTDFEKGAEQDLWKKFTLDKSVDKAYAELPETRGNLVGNPDIARKLSPEYVKNPLKYLRATQGPVAGYIENWYNEKLARPVHGGVILLAGGGGSGKTTALDSVLRGSLDKSDAIVDTPMGNSEKAQARIDRALATGREVAYIYVHNPVEIAAGLVRRRFDIEGRTVPSAVLAADHVNAQETLFKMHERYKNNPSVHFNIIENKIGQAPSEMTFQALEKQRYVKEGQDPQEVIAKVHERIKGVLADVDKKLEEAVGETKQKVSLRDTIANALGFGEKEQGSVIDAAERLRDTAYELKRGQRLYQGSDAGPTLLRPAGRAYFDPGPKRIGLLANANFTSLIHELGHAFLDDSFEFVKSGHADADYINDWRNGMAKMLGIKDDAKGITEAQHEKFATQFERYWADGVAPSLELRGAFARMRNFMVRVYRHANNIGAPISDENRHIFDRMLATEQQIKEAHGYMERSPMPFVDSAEYPKVLKAADLTAKEEMAKSIGDNPIEPDLASAAHIIDNLPTYRAIKALTKGAYKIDPESLPEDLQGKFPKAMLSRDEGIHPDFIAEGLGFRTGDDLLHAVAEADPRDEAIKTMAESRARAADDHAAQQEAALSAVHNDDSMRALMMEHKALVDKYPGENRKALQAVVRRVRPDEAAKANAQYAISRRTVSEIRPQDYVRAEIKARREAFDSWNQGDFDSAIAAKQREMFAHELHREAVKAKKDIVASLRTFNVLKKPDNILAKDHNMALIDAARILTSQMGINYDGTTDPEAHLANQQQMAQRLKAMGESKDLAEKLRYDDVIATINGASEYFGDYKSKSYGYFVAMRDAVQAVIAQSESESQVTLQGKRVALNDIVRDSLGQLSRLSAPHAHDGYTGAMTGWEQVKVSALTLKNHERRMESWLKAVGTGDVNDPLTKVYRRLRDAIDIEFKDAKRSAAKNTAEALEKFAPMIKAGEVIDAPEIDFVWGRDGKPAQTELLHAMMYAASGFEKGTPGWKMLVGRGWGKVDAEGRVDHTQWDRMISRYQQNGTITKLHYDVAQKLLDGYDGINKAAIEKARESGGFVPNKNPKAAPFDTPWGRYKGGFTPYQIDRRIKTDPRIRLEETTNQGTAFMHTEPGWSNTKAQAALFDIGSYQRGVEQSLQQIYIKPAMRDAMRVFGDPRVKNAIAGIDPNAFEGIILPWMDRTVKQRLSRSGANPQFDKAFRYAQATSMKARLMFSFYGLYQDVTKLPMTAQAIGWKKTFGGTAHYLVDSAAHYFRGANDMTKNVMDNSAFMRERIGHGISKEKERINEMLNHPSRAENLTTYVDDNAGLTNSMTHHAMDVITWTGDYNRSLEKGMSHDDAVYSADRAVRLTQGSRAPEDISAAEAGTPFSNLFRSVWGWRNVWANGLMTEGQLAHGGRMKFGFGMNMVLTPLLVSAAIRYATNGDYNSQAADEDGVPWDFAHEFMWDSAHNILGLVPMADTVFSAGVRAAKHGDATLSMSPAVSRGEEAISGAVVGLPHAARAWHNDEALSGKDIVDIATLVDMLTGTFPLEPVGRAIGYSSDVNSGKTVPSSDADYIRGLITGQRGKK